jgi:PAS domain S-box-containing protein
MSLFRRNASRESTPDQGDDSSPPAAITPSQFTITAILAVIALLTVSFAAGSFWQQTPLPAGFWQANRLLLLAAALAGLLFVGLVLAMGLSAYRFVQGRQRAEAAPDQPRLFLEEASDGILITDRRGQVIRSNVKGARMVGYSHEELLQLNLENLILSEDLARKPFPFERLAAGEEVLTERRLRRQDGTILQAEISAKMLLDGRLQVIVRDIGKRKEVEQALRYRMEFEELITAISTQFINVAPEQIDQGITHALQTIGEVAGVDRSCIFLIADDGKTAANSYEWCAAGISSILANQQAISSEYLSWWLRQLGQGDVIHSPRVAKLPTEASLQKFWPATQPPQSLIVVPMLHGRVLRGFVAFELIRARKTWSEDLIGLFKIVSEIFVNVLERKRAEVALQQRNRELELLNRASQALVSTLELDQLLNNVLEEARHLLNVAACSIWLIDPETGELVCRQSSGPNADVVRGWRLVPGDGIVGWVVQHGLGLVIPDAQADERHYAGLDRQIELTTRSLLTVPLLAQGQVIGALQVLDTEVDRFTTNDLKLAEPLAATAAVAIENARLYAQAKQDAETKSILLHEVNHRVKNNLSAIIGLLYAEQRRAPREDRAVYQAIMKELINRVRGLATVHNLLSASEWSPLYLNDLAGRVIHSTLQAIAHHNPITVDVNRSAVRVTPDQASNLALILNELTTNAVKYAWPDGNGAQTKARLRVTIELTQEMIELEYRDNGLGYPAYALQGDRALNTVGFDLVRSLVHIGLRGRLALGNDAGAVITIHFKLQVPLTNGKHNDDS